MHYEGAFVAACRVVAKMPARFGVDLISTPRFQRYAERRFDRRYRVVTAGFERPDELDVPEERLCDATAYSTTSSAKFGCLLAALPLNFRDFTFVDMGCGKGRALLMASEFPFHRIVGVEISAELTGMAQQNIASFRSRLQVCQDVSVVRADATTFEFPAAPVVVYFFNPFSAAILARVLHNLERSLELSPRPVVLIYNNAVHDAVIGSHERFTRHQLDDWHDSRWQVYVTGGAFDGDAVT